LFAADRFVAIEVPAAVRASLLKTARRAERPRRSRESQCSFRSQSPSSPQYATAVYRSELAARLTGLGYEIEGGRSGQPEIRGYSRDYLDASSPRRQQIEDYLSDADRQGAAAARIGADEG
jgi:conjugative relaxase-like TrwC/TraI family protein